MTHNDCIWFRENSAAQAALGRVRELADKWDRLGCPMNRYVAVAELRAAIDGEGA